MASRDKAVEGFRKSLDPLRLTLRTQPFLGGTAANYADYIVFGAFQWARVVSPFKLLAEDDPVYAWRERLLEAFDGLARKSPGYHARQATRSQQAIRDVRGCCRTIAEAVN